MKIDSTGSNFDSAVQAARAESAKRAEAAAAGRVAEDKQADAVRVSPEAQLAAKAVAAANQPDELRADVVDRAKKLLASGELGKDANRLADAIIDRTIANNDHD
jgi:anti-sigma28 factor (negative regulator of flagellin synthesis)